MKVPFNRPLVPARSQGYLAGSLASGHLSGDGPYSRAATRRLSDITGAACHLLTPSCTHALELACRLLDLRPGDEVILPSFNFPSAATAVALTGATPVFVDVDPYTKNLSVEHVRHALTERTRAVIVLHYAGFLAPVEEIVNLARSIGAHVIEDAAHGLGVQTDWGLVGSFGTFATYSFHETKNVQCGEGGALQINDHSFIERAQVLREKGTNRQRFFRGEIDKYSWIDHGSSWLLADPLAAILLGQLDEFDEIQRARTVVSRFYGAELGAWAGKVGFELQSQSLMQDDAAHMYYLVAPNLDTRQRFIEYLRGRGVSSAFHYQPLNNSVAGMRLGRSDSCPVSQGLGDRLVRLPLYASMTSAEMDAVVEAVVNFHDPWQN